MSKFGMGLLQGAQLGRRQLIAFAILSAIINGLVTAGVGAWLAQTYSVYQKKTTAIQTIADLVYERRTRAGMVVWAIKRNAELDELRYRKRAYDEAFVAWNTKTQRNIFMIRDISGQKGVTRLETQFQELLVPGLTATDHCLTKAYDLRLNGGNPMPVLEACQMTHLHQYTLDCAATFTNELDRLTRLSFLPWSGVSDEARKAVEARIDKGCANLPAPKPEAVVAKPVDTKPIDTKPVVAEPTGPKSPENAAATPAATAPAPVAPSVPESSPSAPVTTLTPAEPAK